MLAAVSVRRLSRPVGELWAPGRSCHFGELQDGQDAILISLCYLDHHAYLGCQAFPPVYFLNIAPLVHKTICQRRSLSCEWVNNESRKHGQCFNGQ